MRIEGSFIANIKGRFKESFCLILLGSGFAMLFFYLDQGYLYDPTDMQNLLLVMIGCFGSYIFLIDLFFEDNRKSIIQKHLIFAVAILLVLGVLAIKNAYEKGIQLENMTESLPLLDSAVGLFLIFFLMIFILFLTGDGFILLIKRAKEYFSGKTNETTEVDNSED